MRSCLKYHGGKYYLRHHLLKLMPPHQTYIEPFFGGGQFFFFKPPSFREIVGDKNGALMWMWYCIQKEARALESFLRNFDYSEASFRWAQKTDPAPNIELAARTFIQYRQSIGGRGKNFARPSKNRLRRGLPDNESAWLSAIDLIPQNAKRLEKVDIFVGCDATDFLLLSLHDTPDTLFYLDPPYLPTTRTSKSVYQYEMSFHDHEILLDSVLQLTQAKVMLSGYGNELYDRKLRDWNRHVIKIKNHAAGGNRKREMEEVVWVNT